MVRDHFIKCTELPKEYHEKFQSLKGKNAQGATDSKQYWVYAAKKLGMVDDAENGIKLSPDAKAAADVLPPYGATAESAAAGGAAAAAAASGGGAASTSKSLLKKGAAKDGEEDDKSKLTPFLYALLEHLQMVYLLSSERVGKRKGLPVGLEGLGCNYCCQAGRLGFSRCFPLRRRALPSHVYDLYQHVLRCTLCPQEVKDRLKTLHENNSTGIDEKEVESFTLIWERLGRKRDLTTS